MLQLAAYVHNLDPIALEFPKVLNFLPAPGIRWYGLSYLAGFILGGLLMRRVALVGNTTLKPQNVTDIVVTIAIGGVLGGRAGYVLWYEPALQTRLFDSFPYWAPLAFNHGGMSSHGGILGAILACFYIARRGTPDFPAPDSTQPQPLPQPPEPATRTRHRFLHVLDIAALGTPLGLGLGRIANFINGELYGRPCSPSFPLAVQFPREVLDRNLDLQTLRPAVAVVGVAPEAWDQALADLRSGSTQQAVQSAHQLIRSTLHQLHEATYSGGDLAHAAIEALRPILTPRHPSQLYQAALEGFTLFLILLFVGRRPTRPGVLSGVFALGYGSFRILAEFFREPDPQLGLRWLGLSRGQWLSMWMPALGLAMILWYATRPVPALGGWARNPAPPTSA